MNRSPWYIIAWRLLWIVPLIVTRFLFVLVVLFMHGPSLARELLENTR